MSDDATSRARRACDECGEAAAAFACSRCERSAYCSDKCQRSAWPAHRSRCLYDDPQAHLRAHPRAGASKDGGGGGDNGCASPCPLTGSARDHGHGHFRGSTHFRAHVDGHTHGAPAASRHDCDPEHARAHALRARLDAADDVDTYNDDDAAAAVAVVEAEVAPVGRVLDSVLRPERARAAKLRDEAGVLYGTLGRDIVDYAFERHRMMTPVTVSRAETRERVAPASTCATTDVGMRGAVHAEFEEGGAVRDAARELAVYVKFELSMLIERRAELVPWLAERVARTTRSFKRTLFPARRAQERAPTDRMMFERIVDTLHDVARRIVATAAAPGAAEGVRVTARLAGDAVLLAIVAAYANVGGTYVRSYDELAMSGAQGVRVIAAQFYEKNVLVVELLAVVDALADGLVSAACAARRVGDALDDVDASGAAATDAAVGDVVVDDKIGVELVGSDVLRPSDYAMARRFAVGYAEFARTLRESARASALVAFEFAADDVATRRGIGMLFDAVKTQIMYHSKRRTERVLDDVAEAEAATGDGAAPGAATTARWRTRASLLSVVAKLARRAPLVTSPAAAAPVGDMVARELARQFGRVTVMRARDFAAVAAILFA